MSFVVAQRESLAATASVLGRVGSAVAADEVTMPTATQFVMQVTPCQAVDAIAAA